MAGRGRSRVRNPMSARIQVLATEDFKVRLDEAADKHQITVGEMARMGLEQQLMVLEAIGIDHEVICLTVTPNQKTKYTAAAKRFGYESIEALATAMLDEALGAPSALMAEFIGRASEEAPGVPEAILDAPRLDVRKAPAKAPVRRKDTPGTGEAISLKSVSR